ncbi:MAG: hypothetical protein AVDCRST_MAG79-2198, partial [uncultured Thermoleophilia bacterium]
DPDAGPARGGGSAGRRACARRHTGVLRAGAAGRHGARGAPLGLTRDRHRHGRPTRRRRRLPVRVPAGRHGRLARARRRARARDGSDARRPRAATPPRPVRVPARGPQRSVLDLDDRRAGHLRAVLRPGPRRADRQRRPVHTRPRRHADGRRPTGRIGGRGHESRRLRGCPPVPGRRADPLAPRGRPAGAGARDRPGALRRGRARPDDDLDGHRRRRRRPSRPPGRPRVHERSCSDPSGDLPGRAARLLRARRGLRRVGRADHGRPATTRTGLVLPRRADPADPGRPALGAGRRSGREHLAVAGGPTPPM